MSDGGKGSKQRPFNYQAFAENYDRIFGKERKEYKNFDKQEMPQINLDKEDKVKGT